MESLSIDYSNVLDFISKEDIVNCERETCEALNLLKNKVGYGSDFTGWIDYPNDITYSIISRINEVKDKVLSQSKCLVVVGIGGSYLGAKAVIDALKQYDDDGFEIKYIGNNMSSNYINEVLESLEDIDFTVNVISKSGNTIEPAIAFHLVKDLLKQKYGNCYNERIIVTTSDENSVLHLEAVENRYQEFIIPNNIGGRYSVLTPVGLLPIACAGFDIEKMIAGAIESRDFFLNAKFENNYALQYAAIRNLLYRRGKKVEIFASFEPNLEAFASWWVQLFGESEGKDRKGILPQSTIYSTDLHSLGQYVQDGERILFETFLNVVYEKSNLYIEKSEGKSNLDYLHGKSVEHIKDMTFISTIEAHKTGGVPCIVINIKKINEFNVGYLIYFFMIACGVSGYMLGVNPFNQDGVEEYKKNMYKNLLS